MMKYSQLKKLGQFVSVVAVAVVAIFALPSTSVFATEQELVSCTDNLNPDLLFSTTVSLTDSTLSAVASTRHFGPGASGGIGGQPTSPVAPPADPAPFRVTRSRAGSNVMFRGEDYLLQVDMSRAVRTSRGNRLVWNGSATYQGGRHRLECDVNSLATIPSYR